MPAALETHIDALKPIIYFNHHGYQSICDLISNAAPGDCKIYEFSPAYGCIDFETKAISSGNVGLESFLDAVLEDGCDSTVYALLRDVHGEIEKPEIYDRLKQIADRTMYSPGYHVTIFILSPILSIPPELEHLITLFPIAPPLQNDIENIIHKYAEAHGFEIDDAIVGEIALNLKGLSLFQIKQILDQAYCQGGEITENDIAFIFEEKKQMVIKSGLLEMVDHGENITCVGGLGALKDWVSQKALIFDQLDRAIKAGVSTPKGVLILGLPGCGKSLTAKAIANTFRVPLVRMDIGRLLGKYVGESEEKMRKAFDLAEAISPCVLWIDEIEKAFATNAQGNGHEVTIRLMGQFLTWMQEKQSTVFCVATSNNIEGIPPEFLRKGRFDEIFSVELPSDDERLEIMTIHLKKRNQYCRRLNIHKLIKPTEGFSGADVEYAINAAVEHMFIDGRYSLTDDDLEKGIAAITPISQSLGEKIEHMRTVISKYKIPSATRK